MTDNPLAQAITQIRNAQNILVILESGSNFDAVASGLALNEFLAKYEKKVRVVSPTPVADKLAFLEGSEKIDQGNLKKNLVIEVSLNKTSLAELSYQKQEDKLSIFLLPKTGQFEASDVAVKNNVYAFDLVLTLGVSSLEQLGEFFENHAAMFYEIPTVNIDFRPSNENFGQINLVTLTHASVAETVFELLSQYDATFLDEKIATLLLVGLISATNNFQSPKTSPQIFAKASKLVDLGAKQQEVVTRLYRSKSLGLLRLWGRVLARLKVNSTNYLVSSMTSKQDLEKSQAEPSDINEIIFEMMQQLSFGKTFLFLVENGSGSLAFLATPNNPATLEQFRQYQPEFISEAVIKFAYPKPLLEAESELQARLSPGS